MDKPNRFDGDDATVFAFIIFFVFLFYGAYIEWRDSRALKKEQISFMKKLNKSGEFMERVIERHGKPSEYDQAPQGTVCIVKGKRYVQTSADEEHPKWIEIEC